jgi:dTDP-4-dehydrorhamnose 3,5-epimerase
MQIIKTDIPDVMIIEPKIFGDQRGFFTETFQVERYAAADIKRSFLRDNLSRSSYGILRGLHQQNPRAQGKLVSGSRQGARCRRRRTRRLSDVRAACVG